MTDPILAALSKIGEPQKAIKSSVQKPASTGNVDKKNQDVKKEISFLDPKSISMPIAPPGLSPRALTVSERLEEQKLTGQIIKNEKEMSTLIPKNLVLAILGQLAGSIRTNFVDMARRESADVAARLGIPNQERDLETIWSSKNEEAINSVIAEIDNLSRNTVYEI